MQIIKRTSKELLIKAKNLISKEENWCQQGSAKDLAGAYVSAASPNAIKFCALGSVIASCNHFYDDTYVNATRMLHDLCPKKGSGLILFNDTSTHKEVMDLFDKAIENCGEDK